MDYSADIGCIKVNHKFSSKHHRTKEMILKNVVIFSLVSLLFMTFTSCEQTKRGDYVDGASTVYCDEGFKNILDEEIEVFEYSYPTASIIPYYVSETEALNALLEDKTQGAITTKELTKEQIQYMKNKFKRIVRQKCIAVDAVALITHKNNPVQQLSIDEVGEIISGKITNWSQLAGKDTTRIKLVFDNAGSSTVSFLKDKFLNGKGDISKLAYAQAVKNNSQVFDYIKKDPNAIGIISVSWLGDNLEVAKKVPVNKRMEDYKNENDTIATTLTDKVNIIKISNPNKDNDFSLVGYKPYQAYIATGDYPLFRKVYMISTAPNSTVAHSFFTFVTGFVGQKIITMTGILPFELHRRVVNIRN